MNSKGLLNKLSDYFDMGKKKRKKNAKELKNLLQVLKNEEKKLIAKCLTLSSESKQKKINRKVAVIHAKRKKGLNVLKKLINT
ncbi:MAG: hypothetical protein KAI22_03510 [Gammaproteobacteria bacterium]|nr:hypothetical protein [Gammaproteobacteria bacterium]